MAIKCVCFDIGNVANIPDTVSFLGHLSAKWPNLSLEQLLNIKSGGGVWRQFQNGQINSDQFLASCLNNFGLTESQENKDYLRQGFLIWCGTAYAPILQLASRLKQRSFKTSVLSNNNEIMYCHSSAAIKGIVDVALSSHEIGVSKPDPRAYEILLERIQAIPGEVLMIDDQKHNITSALALGMEAFFFNAKEKPREDLMKDLVNRLNNYGVYIDNSDN
ncbi:HAD-IA family hydrolase [Candidatus Woesearchaeota archaeon]|nr:HAD-IA family hydrolase [Candidatus Woesearchaeota archaeon]